VGKEKKKAKAISDTISEKAVIVGKEAASKTFQSWNKMVDRLVTRGNVENAFFGQWINWHRRCASFGPHDFFFEGATYTVKQILWRSEYLSGKKREPPILGLSRTFEKILAERA